MAKWMPKEVAEYHHEDGAEVREARRQEKPGDHDCWGALSAREESVSGGGEETDGGTAGAGTAGKTGEESREAKMNQRGSSPDAYGKYNVGAIRMLIEFETRLPRSPTGEPKARTVFLAVYIRRSCKGTIPAFRCTCSNYYPWIKLTTAY